MSEAEAWCLPGETPAKLLLIPMVQSSPQLQAWLGESWLPLGSRWYGLLWAGRKALAIHESATCLPSPEPFLLFIDHVQKQSTPNWRLQGALAEVSTGPGALEGLLLSPSCPEAVGTVGHVMLAPLHPGPQPLP